MDKQIILEQLELFKASDSSIREVKIPWIMGMGSPGLWVVINGFG